MLQDNLKDPSKPGAPSRTITIKEYYHKSSNSFHIQDWVVPEKLQNLLKYTLI